MAFSHVPNVPFENNVDVPAWDMSYSQLSWTCFRPRAQLMLAALPRYVAGAALGVGPAAWPEYCMRPAV